MAVRGIALVIAGGLTAGLLGGCSPAPTPAPTLPGATSSPVATPSRDTSTPSASPSVLSGATSLVLSGRVAEACIPPPQGCAYWATLVVPGGDVPRAKLTFDPAHASLGAGLGLPASLPPGRYALVFEVASISDVMSPVPIPDGTPGPAPPEPQVACTSVLDVPDAPVLTVLVTFDGTGCTVKKGP